MRYVVYTKCQCGALAITTERGEEYLVAEENRKTFFPGLDLRRLKRYETTYCCDHCVNHYGVDLCGCGSGEEFGKCTNGLPECEKPMQEIGFYTRVVAQSPFVA